MKSYAYNGALSPLQVGLAPRSKGQARAELRLSLPPIPPSIRVFSNESTLRTRWPKYWSFSFMTASAPLWPALWT